MATTDGKLDAIEHLDFKESRACEYIGDPEDCLTEATWLLTMKCCGNSALMCTLHKDTVCHMINRGRAHRMNTHCEKCRYTFSSKSTIEDILSITPLP